MAETAQRQKFDTRQVELRARAGVLAGLVAAIGMGILAMVISYSLGEGAWFPFDLITGVFFGVSAVLGGPELAALGVFMHLFTGAVLGMIFAVLVSPLETARQAFWEGVIFGVLVWLVMSYLILPLLNPTMAERVAVVSGWWFLCHVAYGTLLYITPEIHRGFESRLQKNIPVAPGV
jgi:uncharacterized membrane protein YagU involved in acid resistance